MRYNSLLLIGLYIMVFGTINAQNLKMDPNVFDIWTTIKSQSISDNGEWVTYCLTKEDGDAVLYLKNTSSIQEFSFPRGVSPVFSNDSNFLIFKIKPSVDSLDNMKRNKIPTDKIPKDTLAIFDIAKKEYAKVPNIQSYKTPKKGEGWMAYKMFGMKSDAIDSTDTEALKKNKTDLLVVRELSSGAEEYFLNVDEYLFSEEGQQLAFNSKGDSAFLAGVYLLDLKNDKFKPLHREKGNYKKLSFNKNGSQIAFLSDLDTTTNEVRPYQLHHYQNGMDSAKVILHNQSAFVPKSWLISNNRKLEFSDDNQTLFFGIAPPPALRDTNLLDNEIVNVEVWHYKDPVLYTEQEVKADDEKNRSHLSAYHLSDKSFVQLGNQNIPNVIKGNRGNSEYLIGYNERPYFHKVSWEGFPSARDLYLINAKSGKSEKVLSEVKGSTRFSPGGKYAYWFDQRDTSWHSFSIEKRKSKRITNNKKAFFFDEINDRPMIPFSYRTMAWEAEDANVYIYDRYDIWKVNPDGKGKAKRITSGREKKIKYRYIRLDKEERFIQPDATILLQFFNETTKEAGFVNVDLKTGIETKLESGPFRFTRNVQKARNADKLIFTKENYQVFPDLIASDLNFKNQIKISKANPQQKDYAWGTVELYSWVSKTGENLKGLLVKPQGFDPKKKYPMIVNFYERSTDGLHRHRAPYPHRSTINYSYYSNRGYVIFNPDVPYEVGYPGRSAYNSVVSGTEALIKEGFIDKDRIGVQGHSWGGYQIAHLVTKTDLFKCAESGAPVVNMFSAYGGIRWRSGLSRMFQYEQTQSRIGATIWEKPELYIENSPIFNIDKINTPVLILHNDKDGAVPWYQGIEFFVAMRRLGKPAWLLNYNNEPHWPLKRQNRLDFNKRMEQFFDHYLMDAPKPMWMEQGVPAIHKGIHQGFELIKK